jgi:uncharacterized hydrophobic protein (TIGR00271 family)
MKYNFQQLFPWYNFFEAPTHKKDIEEIVTKGSMADFPFFLMITISSVIATFGLLANSAAVIIGAMIIAPLMNPIIAISYWLLTGKRILIIRSILTLVLGTLLCILVSFLISNAIGWKLAGSEIIARMKPNLLDLGVALAAGAAAAFAYTRASVSAAFAGIAIAVALIPPLCTVGITLAVNKEIVTEVGIAFEEYDQRGPFLLFLTNFIGIVFAGSLVFFFQYFRKRLSAILILSLTMISLGAVAYPLGLRMKNLIIRNQIRRNLTLVVVSLLPKDYNSLRLRNLYVRIGDEFIYVRANAISRPGLINQTFVNELQNELSEKTQKQVVLEVGIIEEPVIKSANNLIIPKKNLGMPD